MYIAGSGGEWRGACSFRRAGIETRFRGAKRAENSKYMNGRIKQLEREMPVYCAVGTEALALSSPHR